jgi:hypothetical protein
LPVRQDPEADVLDPVNLAGGPPGGWVAGRGRQGSKGLTDRSSCNRRRSSLQRRLDGLDFGGADVGILERRAPKLDAFRPGAGDAGYDALAPVEPFFVRTKKEEPPDVRDASERLPPWLGFCRLKAELESRRVILKRAPAPPTPQSLDG